MIKCKNIHRYVIQCLFTDRELDCLIVWVCLCLRGRFCLSLCVCLWVCVCVGVFVCFFVSVSLWVFLQFILNSGTLPFHLFIFTHTFGVRWFDSCDSSAWHCSYNVPTMFLRTFRWCWWTLRWWTFKWCWWTFRCWTLWRSSWGVVVRTVWK